MNPICQNCDAQCCKSFDYVCLTDQDAERMRELGAEVILDEDTYIMNVQGGCQFLKEGKCSIYKQRPKSCKEWSCDLLRKYREHRSKFLA